MVLMGCYATCCIIPTACTFLLHLFLHCASHTTQAQLALGNMGMPILISILRDERQDTALLRGAVECLHVSMAQAPKSHQQETQATPAHAMNAEMYTRNKEHMSLLLSLFDDGDGNVANGQGAVAPVQRDFYIRYHAVKTLAALMHATPFRVQEVRYCVCQHTSCIPTHIPNISMHTIPYSVYAHCTPPLNTHIHAGNCRGESACESACSTAAR